MAYSKLNYKEVGKEEGVGISGHVAKALLLLIFYIGG